MSDTIGYAPSATQSSRSADVTNSKGDAAPLKAFEAALLNVQVQAAASQSSQAQSIQPQSGNPAPTQGAIATAAPSASRSTDRGPSGAASGGSQSQAAVAEAAGGPQPAARSASTATAGSVRANAETDVAAKLRQGQLDGAKSQAAKAAGGANRDASTQSPANGVGAGGVGASEVADSSGGVTSATTSGADDAAIVDGLAPTTALSSALTSGTAADVKAALQTTLQGFADGTVPEAIKAAINKNGSVSAQQSAAEIGGLLDNISSIAQDIIARGPISDADFANAFDQLFWVSNWFDLFNVGSGTGNTANDPIYNSVNSAMAVPMDIFFTRAVMVPLIDTERVVSPGLVNRRAVRANTEAVPGSETVDRPQSSV
jgi:hypothetical protein